MTSQMKTITSLPDAEVVQKVLNGESALYEIIVRRYNPYLYKVGRSYNYNHEDTQDLMQDTFIDAYRSLGQFEGRANFKTWILRIMLNNCYRRRLKMSVANEVTSEIEEDAQPMFSSNQGEPHSIAHNNEVGRIIEQALAKLPEDYRLVFAMREINGCNVAETAQMLNITEVNVKVRLNRAKAMLRHHIEKLYAPEELYEFNAVYCDAMVRRVMAIIEQEEPR